MAFQLALFLNNALEAMSSERNSEVQLGWLLCFTPRLSQDCDSDICWNAAVMNSSAGSGSVFQDTYASVVHRLLDPGPQFPADSWSKVVSVSCICYEGSPAPTILQLTSLQESVGEKAKTMQNEGCKAHWFVT